MKKVKRVRDPDETRDLRELVLDVVPDAERWIETPNPHFDGLKPADLIGTEKERHLRNLVRAIQIGNVLVNLRACRSLSTVGSHRHVVSSDRTPILEFTPGDGPHGVGSQPIQRGGSRTARLRDPLLLGESPSRPLRGRGAAGVAVSGRDDHPEPQEPLDHHQCSDSPRPDCGPHGTVPAASDRYLRSRADRRLARLRVQGLS